MSVSRTGDGGALAIVPRLAKLGGVCRCGRRIPVGGECVEVQGLSGILEGWLHGQVYCSPRCVRASFLEDLSILEAIDTPQAEAQVTDLRETYLQLASAFSRISSGEAEHRPAALGA